jgi:hypothetical protein
MPSLVTSPTEDHYGPYGMLRMPSSLYGGDAGPAEFFLTGTLSIEATKQKLGRERWS